MTEPVLIAARRACHRNRPPTADSTNAGQWLVSRWPTSSVVVVGAFGDIDVTNAAAMTNYALRHALIARGLILTNTYITSYRKKQRRPAEHPTEEITDWQLAASAEHTSRGLRSAEVEALDALPDTEIKAALESLSDNIRMAVYYADAEGLPYQEIAQIMDTPIGTVMSRLHRGRHQLRALLAGVAKERGYTRNDFEAPQEAAS